MKLVDLNGKDQPFDTALINPDHVIAVYKDSCCIEGKDYDGVAIVTSNNADGEGGYFTTLPLEKVKARLEGHDGSRYVHLVYVGSDISTVSLTTSYYAAQANCDYLKSQGLKAHTLSSLVLDDDG